MLHCSFDSESFYFFVERETKSIEFVKYRRLNIYWIKTANERKQKSFSIHSRIEISDVRCSTFIVLFAIFGRIWLPKKRKIPKNAILVIFIESINIIIIQIFNAHSTVSIWDAQLWIFNKKISLHLRLRVARIQAVWPFGSSSAFHFLVIWHALRVLSFYISMQSPHISHFTYFPLKMYYGIIRIHPHNNSPYLASDKTKILKSVNSINLLLIKCIVVGHWPLAMKMRTTHTDRCRIRCIFGFYLLLLLLLFLFRIRILISHCIVGISIQKSRPNSWSWKNFSLFLYRCIIIIWGLLPFWVSEVHTAWNEFQRITLSHPIDSIKGHGINDE